LLFAFVYFSFFQQAQGQSSTDMVTLKERHKARHAIRDKRAGGAGLGVLETKSKHFKAASTSGSVSPPSPRRTPSSSTARCQLSPPVTDPPEADQSRRASNVSDSVPFLSHQHSEHWSSPPELQGSELTTDYLNSQLTYPNNSQMANMYVEQSSGLYEIGNMYHDMTFDLVHFNVTGFAPQLPDYRPSAVQPLAEEASQSPSSAEGQLLSLVPSPMNNHSIMQHEADAHFSGVSNLSQNALKVGNENVRRDERMTEDAAENVIRTPIVESIFSATSPTSEDRSHTMTSLLPAYHAPESALNESQATAQEVQRSHIFTSEKRDEVLEFIADIGPVRPDGTPIDGNSPDFSLENLQTYLDLFFEFFNTSYPLIHVATLDINDTDPIALLSLMLLGATYKDKDAHQLSVCLYDAIVPYILSGLLSGPVPDLAILQAFLVLECYGMYRAGPYQRENAILIHGLLLNVRAV
jgi:Fungal specific transcription factor domain